MLCFRSPIYLKLFPRTGNCSVKNIVGYLFLDLICDDDFNGVVFQALRFVYGYSVSHLERNNLLTIFLSAIIVNIMVDCKTDQ